MDSVYTGAPDSSSTGVTDPRFQAVAQQLGYRVGTGLTAAQYQDVLYHMDPSAARTLPASMRIEDGHVVDYDRNANAGKIIAIVGAGLIAAPLIAGALGGAAPTTGSTLGSLSGDAGTTAANAGTTAATTAGAGAGTTAATAIPSGLAASLPSEAAVISAPAVTAGTSLWSKISSVAAPVASVAGSIIQANAQGNATAAQVAAAKDALDFQKQQYADENQRLTPYRDLGANAAGRLGSLWGLSTTTGPQPAPSQNGTASVASGVPTSGIPVTGVQPAPGNPWQTPGSPSTSGTIGSLGQPNSMNTALVTVRAPTGETKQVSPAVAEFYKSMGATVVPTGATA